MTFDEACEKLEEIEKKSQKLQEEFNKSNMDTCKVRIFMSELYMILAELE